MKRLLLIILSLLIFMSCSNESATLTEREYLEAKTAIKELFFNNLIVFGNNQYKTITTEELLGEYNGKPASKEQLENILK